MVSVHMNLRFFLLQILRDIETRSWEKEAAVNHKVERK